MEIVKQILEAVWTFLNSATGAALVVSVFGWIIAKVFTAKPEWLKWKPQILQAVKLAEKDIPDDTPNAGLARFDWALKRLQEALEKETGRMLTPPELDVLKGAITLVHDEAEAKGTV